MYGDQVARFEASTPHEGIREALVDAGWLRSERAERLDELGVTYVSAAHFEFELAERRRLIKVDLKPDGDTWLLRVSAHEIARAQSRLLGVRRLTPNGTPLPDSIAPHAAYDVALVLHRHLSAVAKELTWARDRTPTQTDSHDGPVPPPNPSG
jgi:hypothetical protein